MIKGCDPKLCSCSCSSACADRVLGAGCSLQARGSKLILLRGSPQEQLPLFWREHQVTDLVFESDTGGAATVPPISPDHTLASISLEACNVIYHPAHHYLRDQI